jgi:hypothetical protein
MVVEFAHEGMNRLEVKAGYNMVLSTYATGYTNAEFKGRYLSPFAEVPARSGSVIQFDDSAFDPAEDDRADGGPFNEIQDGYEGHPFSLRNKGLAYKVPLEHEEEAATANINLGKRASNSLMRRSALNIELEQARMARNPANYNGLVTALSGGSQFNDQGSRPDQAIETAKLAIVSRTGHKPNVILGGEQVVSALRTHPLVRANFQPTSSMAINDEMLAQYFNVSRFVSAEAVWRNKATGAKGFIWGKDLILAYVNPKAFEGDADGRIPYTVNNDIDRMTEPSKFYTYVLKGVPKVSNAFWWEMNDSWYYKIRFERDHHVTGMDSGYLIQNAIA